MSTVSTTGLYAEDLHGINPANLITNERHTLQTPGREDYYFIIPKAAPFFADSIKVSNALTGVPYVEGQDFLVGHLFIEAMKSIGRPIAGSIRFMRHDIAGQVSLEYRTVGGQWGFNDAAVLAELARKQYNPLIRTWGSLDVLPATFPVLVHDESIDSLIGGPEIEAALIRIAETIEATASGTTEQHLEDFLNPHRVNKTQVGLGEVPNFAMANDQQAQQADRSDLFISPRGTLLAIQLHALTPLTNHVNATGNVHGLTANDINLGNVPNFPKATPTTAIDMNNDAAFMTPYTVGLLLQEYSPDNRLDQLEQTLNNHLLATNPHGITAAQVGTYNSQEIDDLLAQVGGGDATTFGGMAPEEWRATLPSFADLVEILEALRVEYAQALADLGAVDPEDPTTPEEAEAARLALIQGAVAMHDTYAVFDGNWDIRIIASTANSAFPEIIQDGQDKWAALENANYYLDAQGAIVAFGSAVLSLPAAYVSGPSFNVANKMVSLWATRTTLYAELAPSVSGEPGRIIRFTGPGAPTQIFAEVDKVTNIILGTEHSAPGILGIVEREDIDGNPTFTAIGDSNWVTTCTSALNYVASQGSPVADVRINETHVIILTDVNRVYVYALTRTPNPTLTLVPAPMGQYGDGRVVNLATLTDVSSISGRYKHFALLNNTHIDNPFIGEAVFFGDNSECQQDITDRDGWFYAVAAGHNFTVTVNKMNHVQFWGDSPDNSLNYGNRGLTL